MPLSISNSNTRLPEGPWLRVWTLVGLLLAAVIIFLESSLRVMGWSPSLVDSEQLWALHRQRASEIGEKAIIFIGKSRIQLGLDLTTVKAMTGLEPVQLAINGASFVPVLENLANDPAICGVVVVSIDIEDLYGEINVEKADQWVGYYLRQGLGQNEPYRIINDRLKLLLAENSAVRLEGARPWTVIRKCFFDPASNGNFILTNYDRSRDADYAKADIIPLYARQVRIRYGKQLVRGAVSVDHFIKVYMDAIARIKAENNGPFLKRLDLVMRYVDKIRQRGGQVVIARLPTGKLLWEIDKRKFPRDQFWSELERRYPYTIHFKDDASLAGYNLPDGSHLDYRDKKAFTTAFIHIVMGLLNDRGPHRQHQARGKK